MYKREDFALLIAAAAFFVSGADLMWHTRPPSVNPSLPPAAAMTPDAVWNALISNPDRLDDLVKAFQVKKADAARNVSVATVNAALPDIFRAGDPFLGNAAAKKEIAVFSDYSCPHCREAEPAMHKAVLDDKDLKIIIRDFPVLGPASILASRAALAAKNQNLYMPMHEALLLQSVPLSAEKIDAAAKAAGVDLDRMHADMESDAVTKEIDATLALGRRLDVSGTPSFVGKDVGTLVGYSDDGRFAAFLSQLKAN